MERILISNINSCVGETLTVSGFIQTIRDQGKIKFLLLRDISGTLQIVVLKNHEAAFEAVAALSLESVITVTGLVKEEKQAPSGYELEAHTIVVESLADANLPIPVVSEKGGEETDIAIRLDWRFLDLRKRERVEIFKIWTHLEEGFRKFFTANDFLQIYTPSFMVSPSESGSEVFEVEYFDRKAYLAQSPQFFKQMAMASGLEKVFIVGPVFRAEPSYTTRHMTEFTGWDFEISYIKSHYDVMETEENLLATAFEHLKNSGHEVTVPTLPFPKLKMTEVKAMLREAGVVSEKEHDLSPEEERELSRLIKQKHDHDFVFVTNYHKSIRPFYHMRDEENTDETKSFDLLYRGIEITTGAQREHRLEILAAQAQEKGMALASIEDYLNYFKYGCPPHGGVGIGPGRIVMQLLGLPSVKEATFLPRDVKRLRP